MHTAGMGICRGIGKQPRPLPTNCHGANGIFGQDVADPQLAIRAIHRQFFPLIVQIGHRFACQAVFGHFGLGIVEPLPQLV